MPKLPGDHARIRIAHGGDLAALARLLTESKTSGMSGTASLPRRQGSVTACLNNRILDKSLLLAELKGVPLALAGVDIDRACIAEWVFSPKMRDQRLARLMVEAAERLAVSFGILKLKIKAPARWNSLLGPLGYKSTAPDPGTPLVCYARSLRRRQTKFGRHVQAIARELGIPANYGRQHRLPLQVEASRLRSIGEDIFGRDQRMAPRAASAWERMQIAAGKDGIQLLAVSAFRSLAYQRDLLSRKLAKGQLMGDILKVSAAPGFSEHHTGRAIDVTTPRFAALEEEFETSPAFSWLRDHANGFGFRLSFPRSNRHGLAYEPWHWYFEP